MLNEALENTWGEILDSVEGVEAIKGDYRRTVTGIMLENEKNALAEAAPTNVAAGVAGYDPVLMSMVRRAAPKMIAFDICGVQPMTLPTGLVFAMRSRYTNQSGTEALFAEADTTFSGTGVYTLSATTTNASATVTVDDSSRLVPGMAIAGTGIPASTTIATIVDKTTITISANATASGTVTAQATVYQSNGVGDGLTTATGEGDITAKMGFSIEKILVSAKTHQLATGYSVELAQDLKALHGIDADAELSSILTNELLAEQNRTVLRTVYYAAKAGAQKGTATAGTFNVNGTDSDGRWMGEKFKSLLFAIQRDSNAIAVDTKLGRGNVLICSPDVASALASTGLLNYAPALENLEDLGSDFLASTFVGTLRGQMKVFVDPYATADFYVVGFKGNQYQAGIYFCPYVMAQIYRAQDPASFQPLLGIKQRYGLVANPMNGSSTNNNGLVFRNNSYYRNVSVTNLY